MLKSFLLAEGVSAARLKSKAFGHDLVALMRAAEARGIASLIELNHTYRGVVQLLNFDFTSKRFEYYITDATYLLPNITPTRQLVKRLLKEVDSHLKSRHGI